MPFIALNSNEKRETQARWLEPVPAHNPNRWTIAVFHRPVFSAARGRDNLHLRQLWMSVFDKYRVDKLSCESRTATGELYGASELHKQDGGTNLLVSNLPRRPGEPPRINHPLRCETRRSRRQSPHHSPWRDARIAANRSRQRVEPPVPTGAG